MSLSTFRRLVVTALVIGACTGAVPFGPLRAPQAAAATLSTQDKIKLQAAMSRYIERHTVGDAYLFVDTKTGDVTKYYPVTQHPMIVKLKDVMVLCADLKTREGATVNVDFYAARDGANYTVFQAEIDRRPALESLVKSGVAAMVD